MPKVEANENLFKLIRKKAIMPSLNEIKKNPPSRSAKLRFAIKHKEIFGFEKFVLEKFDYLLKVEKLSEKI